jgi:hypothetical protein
MRRRIEVDDELLSVVKRIRGVVTRVATKLDVHPTFVSHVIHGERKSAEVVAELRNELQAIRNILDSAVLDKLERP